MMGNKIIHAVITAALSLWLLSACQSLPSQAPASQAQAKATTEEEGAAASQAETPPSVPLSSAPSTSGRGREEIVEIGTGQYVAEPGPTEAPVNETEEGEITLNFQETNLREFIKAILGDVLNENYVIDPNVSGTVTVETTRPLHVSELLPLFETLLEMNNAALIRADGLYRILPRDQAVRGNLAPSTVERPGQEGYSVRMIPLQYVAAPEMQTILEPFVSDTGELRIDRKRNMIIISGTSQEIETVQRTVDLFDVDWLRGMSLALHPLDYVSPDTMQSELDAIINGIEGEGSEGMLGGLVRTVPLARLNSILLIASTATALREVEIWMHRLDQPGDIVGRQIYVYKLENAKATELSDILGNIFRGSTRTRRAEGPGPAELAPGLQPIQISPQQRGMQRAEEPQPSTSQSDPGGASTGIASLENNTIEIIADDVRNALVVMATPQEYKMVEATIGQLDTVPLQVLIEASIIEVTLNDNLNYGVEWFFKNSIDRNNARGGEATLDLGESGLSALVPGFSYVINTADDVRFALNALAEESEVNVLSSPSLMVLDNQTASINVGDEIPVPTRQSVSVTDAIAPTVNEIQFRQTGVTLTVTPRVNTGGLVTMEIRQEVSNAVSTTTSDLNAPTIQQRQVESVVAINSGETIVLGGLIQDTQTVSNGGIPGLRRIPLLGGLFGQSRDEKRRTELLVFITPRVVSNRNEAREITEELRKKLQGLQRFPPSGT